MIYKSNNATGNILYWIFPSTIQNVKRHKDTYKYLYLYSYRRRDILFVMRRKPYLRCFYRGFGGI